MKGFQQAHGYLKKKVGLERWRVKKAIKGAISVPFEFADLRSSYAIKQEQKVYPHEELEGLGMKTIKWDGL